MAHRLLLFFHKIKIIFSKFRGIKKATYLSNVVGSVKNLKKAFITNLRLPGKIVVQHFNEDNLHKQC